jgi:HSP20 family protein
MEGQAAGEFVQAPEMLKLVPDDPFIELAREINNLIARRAYDLYESGGSAHGRDRENWLRAESEILFNAPVDIRETETAVTIRVDVPGFDENDLEVRIAPPRLCITGQRPEASEQQEGSEGKTVYSERRSGRIFRVLDLPSQIDQDLTEATLRDGILEITLLKTAEMGKKVPVLAKAARA